MPTVTNSRTATKNPRRIAHYSISFRTCQGQAALRQWLILPPVRNLRTAIWYTVWLAFVVHFFISTWYTFGSAFTGREVKTAAQIPVFVLTVESAQPFFFIQSASFQFCRCASWFPYRRWYPQGWSPDRNPWRNPDGALPWSGQSSESMISSVCIGVGVYIIVSHCVNILT